MGLHSGRPASVTKHEAWLSAWLGLALQQHMGSSVDQEVFFPPYETFAGDRPLEICWTICSDGEGDRGQLICRKDLNKRDLRRSLDTILTTLTTYILI